MPIVMHEVVLKMNQCRDRLEQFACAYPVLLTYGSAMVVLAKCIHSNQVPGEHLCHLRFNGRGMPKGFGGAVQRLSYKIPLLTFLAKMSLGSFKV